MYTCNITNMHNIKNNFRINFQIKRNSVDSILHIYCFRYCISIFIIPLVILVYTYTCICWEIWHSSDLRPRNSQKMDPNKRIPFISRAKINTVKQTIAVIVMYIISSAPFIIGQLWAVIDPYNPFLDGKSNNYSFKIN